MHRTSLLAALALTSAACAPPNAGDDPPPGEPEVQRDPAAPFALVELYTSEG